MSLRFSLSNIAGRLLALFVAIAIGVGVIGTFLWGELNDVAQEAGDIAERRVPQLERALGMRLEIANIRTLGRQALLDGSDMAALGRTREGIEASLKQLNTLLGEFEQFIFSAKAKEQVAALKQSLPAYQQAVQQWLAALQANDSAKVASLQSEVDKHRQSIIATLDEVVAWQKQVLRNRVNNVLADVTHTKQLMAGMGAVLLLVMVAALTWLVRLLARRMGEAQVVAQRIASKDLSVPVAVTGRDEFTPLLRDLSAMRNALLEVVQAARQASDSIQVAASEVASGNRDLAARTEAAASSVEETASSMEEINSTVKQTADSAAQANQLAATATDVANRGGQVVHQVVATMQDIQASSQKIADIIGVIDGIAFQTNILALNAAVEAARAGEQGRGFAVVAGEVRSLAQRSAQAAKEIKDLIQTSVSKVATGSELVQQAGASMQDIVASVQRVTDVMGEITAAAAEQSNGIAQVNVAINQLDQTTQQNAALVEQSTAAAESLREQATRLAEVVSVFRLDPSSHHTHHLPALPDRS